MDAQDKGKDAEQQACRHLEALGLRTLQRNYRSRFGEIDLIMRDKDSLVFVEVRYRRQHRYGSGAESVDRRKQAKLLACARHYLLTNPKTSDRPCRFDVVAISGDHGSADIQWIRNAFTATT